jgi:hypothetical protein
MRDFGKFFKILFFHGEIFEFPKKVFCLKILFNVTVSHGYVMR